MSSPQKYRAWDDLNKKWLLGYELPELGGFSMMGEVMLFGEYQGMLNSFQLKDWDYIKIMQFTGIVDKNKKDVYEDDIVKYQHSIDSKEYIGQVVYNREFASFWLKTGNDSGFALLGQQKIIEVIGNLYETPELLKKN